MQDIQPLAVVGVMGSGSDAQRALCDPLGELVARLGAHLLTGGGGGVMAAVARSFCAFSGRRGQSLAVLPGHPAPTGYPNAWVEIALRTHLPLSGSRGTEPLSRNHLNVLSSDVIVALPGGAGTESEIALALRYGRPLIALGEHSSELPHGVPVARSVGELEPLLSRALAS